MVSDPKTDLIHLKCEVRRWFITSIISEHKHDQSLKTQMIHISHLSLSGIKTWVTLLKVHQLCHRTTTAKAKINHSYYNVHFQFLSYALI